jgi:hypothetical protein
MIWTLIAQRIYTNTGADRSTLLVTVSDRSLKGTFTKDGITQDMKPAEVNGAMLAVLNAKLKAHLRSVDRYTVSFDHVANTATVTSYGTDHNGEKVSFNENVNL